MNLGILSVAAAGVLGLMAPCGGAPRLPRGIDGALQQAKNGKVSEQTVQVAKKTAEVAADGAEVAGEAAVERQKCDALRTQEVAFDEERALGEATVMQIARDHGGIAVEAARKGSRAQTEYLNTVGHLLASHSERPELPWTFGIVLSDDVNAFSTPGGFVFVTEGLLKKVQNEAQLAGVLAHEIAHVSAQHALNYYRPMKVTACQNEVAAKAAGKAIAVTARSGVLGSSTGHIDFAGAPDLLEDLANKMAAESLSRKVDPAQEKQADHDAVALMIATGYRPSEYVAFLETLPEVFQKGSHPPKKDRIASVNTALKQMSDPKMDPLRSAGAPFGEAEGFRAPRLPFPGPTAAR